MVTQVIAIIPEGITDSDLTTAMGELSELVAEKETRDFDLCEKTRDVLWNTLLISQRVHYTLLDERHGRKIESLLQKAYNKAQKEEYKENILERKREILNYLRTGSLQLSKNAQDFICNQYGEEAKRILRDF